jgi:hypothetical protein
MCENATSSCTNVIGSLLTMALQDPATFLIFCHLGRRQLHLGWNYLHLDALFIHS